MANKITPTAWVGWVYFAGVMLLAIGGVQIISGLVSLLHHSFYVVSSSHLVAFNYTTWGWTALFIGVLILLAGFGVLAGALWARIVATILAVLSLLDNVAFITAYPLWSIIAIVINGFVIYALTMHGAEAGVE